MSPPNVSGSIRRRLIWQLLVAAALLTGLMYFAVRSVAGSAVERTQDRILGAATIAIAEELRGGEDGVEIDIPYSAFSMLGAMGNDRIFYRIDVDGVTATGYDDLPIAGEAAPGLDPTFHSARYQGDDIRVAVVSRSVLVEARQVPVLVIVAQTRSAQAAIIAGLQNRAAILGLGFFALASILAVLAARSVVQPVNSLAEALARRGPQDLRPVARTVPEEMEPMVAALNGFIARLAGTLSRTETFIAEAAHYIRTPLTTLRNQSEIALHQSNDPATSDSLRRIIRLADDTARSAGQLLDHAAVSYRADQRSDEPLDLSALVAGIVEGMRPSADLRDISIHFDAPPVPMRVVADRVLIETVIRNLLDNAIKYSREDGRIELTLAVADRLAALSVRDRGRGLSGAGLDQLKGRFKRGDNVGDVVGSGLGLAIVAEVAQAYSGQFELTEADGGGACARFSLPLA